MPAHTPRRVAPCSYDRIDDAGRRSPRTQLDLPEPRPGDPFSTFAGSRDVRRVVPVEPGRRLAASVLGALRSYVLLPRGRTTRLLLEVVLPRPRWYGRALALSHWPVARRPLLTFEDLTEGAGAADG